MLELHERLSAEAERRRRNRAINRELRKVLALIIFGCTAVMLAIILSAICWLAHAPLAIIITWPKVQHLAGILVLTGIAMFLLVTHLAR
jgi:hypothetical protein